jgi:Restriction endonuclease
MSPVRKTTGKAISPLRRPSIAGVRELRIAAPAIVSFPLPPGLSLIIEEAPTGVAAQVPEPAFVGLPPGTLDRPVVEALFSILGRPEYAANDPSFRLPSMDGGRMRRAVETGREAPGGRPPWLEAITPILLAPAQEPDIAAALGARPYQQDAAQALIANPRFLLADDPGTGKLRAVCLALSVLAAQGQVHRALIAAPRERLPAWRRELETFLPELERREIRGTSAERLEQWSVPGFVVLSPVEDLAEDLEAGVPLPAFDLILLDRFMALVRRRPGEIRRVSRLEAARRWALAGSVPADADDWRVLLGFLSPDVASSPVRPGTGELRERFTQNVLRRSKAELVRQMPRLTRREIWLELDRVLGPAYASAWANERERLRRLGSSLSRSHIQASLDTLKQACNFAPESYDGPKVRALVDLAEEITSGRSKLVVFTTYGETTASRLLPALEAFGVVRLRADSPASDQEGALARFRAQPGRRVLVADLDARGDGGSLDPATYVLHFDHDWNPALRRRAEQRFFPDLGPTLPLSVYELWVSGTIEESYHRALEERQLLASNLPQDTQPADLDEKLSLEDWRTVVFEAGPGQASMSAPSVVGGTGSLPGTGTLRSRLVSLTPEQWASAAEGLLRIHGFETTRRLTSPDESGLTLLACRPGGGECVYVRCLKTQRSVGVAEARQALEEADRRPDCDGVYLLATTEFTPACKKFAEEARGHLVLLGGADLYRHLRGQGIVP